MRKGYLIWVGMVVLMSLMSNIVTSSTKVNMGSTPSEINNWDEGIGEGNKIIRMGEEVSTGGGNIINNYGNTTYVNTSEIDPIFKAENSSLWTEAKNKYNATYDSALQYCYNHSSVLINQYGSTWVNHSSILFGQYGSTWVNHSSILFSQYGSTWVNHTLLTYNTYNDVWSSTSNESYLLRGTNDTINIKYQNITNIPSCTSGQFLTNTSGLSCATPTASSNEVMILKTADQLTANITWWGILNFTFNATAGSRYLFDCDIITNASANTIGLSVNITSNTTPTNYLAVLSTYSSATAILSLSTVTISSTLVGTGQAGASPLMNSELHGTINTTNGGTVVISMRPDQAGTLQVNKGSYCEITKTG